MVVERPPFERDAVEALESLRELLRWAATVLGHAELCYGHGTDSAWDEAVALVLDGLRLPRDRFEQLADARVDLATRRWLAEALRRRVEERVPVPYLTGLAWFVGLSFEVDRRVIVPRSPIAELLEAGLQPWLGNRLPLRILDLAAGSGCIGVAAAHVFEAAEVTLADVDIEALEVATRNVARHGLQARVRTRAADLFAGLGDARYDLILCNPPYVDAETMARLPPEYRHEPRHALAAGEDGLALAARVVRGASAYLEPRGLLVLELGDSASTLAERFPHIPFTWPALERGGSGVLLVEAEDLPAS